MNNKVKGEKVKMLSKSELMEELKLKTDVVTLSAGGVLLTELSAPSYASVMGKSAMKDGNGIDMDIFNPLLIVNSVVDEKGERFFDEKDVEIMKTSSATTYNKLLLSAQRLNGISGTEEND